MFDGQRSVLAYSDALTEITFTVPTSSSHGQLVSQLSPSGHSATLQAELTSSHLGICFFLAKASNWLKGPKEVGLQPASSHHICSQSRRSALSTPLFFTSNLFLCSPGLVFSKLLCSLVVRLLFQPLSGNNKGATQARQ